MPNPHKFNDKNLPPLPLGSNTLLTKNRLNYLCEYNVDILPVESAGDKAFEFSHSPLLRTAFSPDDVERSGTPFRVQK